MSYEVEDKMVSHPDHYKSGQYEVIDIIDEFTKDLKGTEAVCTANAIKYILRWKKKNGIQDIKKAIWYLTHLTEYLENKCRECIDANYSINADEGCEGCVFAKKHEAKEYAEEENSEDDPINNICMYCENYKSCIRCYQRTDDCFVQRNDDPVYKEESDLSVDTHTNVAGVTVPDSEPWISSEDEHTCHNCGYHLRKHDLEPCKSCNWYSNWKSKEVTIIF